MSEDLEWAELAVKLKCPWLKDTYGHISFPSLGYCYLTTSESENTRFMIGAVVALWATVEQDKMEADCTEWTEDQQNLFFDLDVIRNGAHRFALRKIS